MADPVWLSSVIRDVGLICDDYPGAYNRGHGDMPGVQWGIMWHHTGATGTPGPGAIARHPTLGLASQLYLARNGRWTLCGVGIAYHAGPGRYPGIPDNNANPVVIGIEAENSGSEGWSQAQYGSYVVGSAAILRRLGRDAARMIGHREWSSEGKWDPGMLDLDIARVHLAHALATLAGGRNPDPRWYRVNNRQVVADVAMSDRQLLQETWDQLRGPAGKGWPQLGGRTPVDALAAILVQLEAIQTRLDALESGQ